MPHKKSACQVESPAAGEGMNVAGGAARTRGKGPPGGEYHWSGDFPRIIAAPVVFLKTVMEHREHYPLRRFLYPTAFRKAGPDVGWEPTPAGVVEQMIALARLRDTDLAYDLGCGDGRIVIAAAKAGARGVGIDLDERRIAESRENALAAGVGDLTRFVKGDLFEADIGDASVLFLFLFPDVNLRLRPKLLGELKAGARIVSYSHDMGRWRPDEVDGDTYLWIAPGDLSGTWRGAAGAGPESVPLQMAMRQEFQRVSGAVFVGERVFQVRGAVMAGERFSFGDGDDRRGETVSLSGSVAGDTAAGFVEKGPLPRRRLPFLVRRDPSTRIPLAQ